MTKLGNGIWRMGVIYGIFNFIDRSLKFLADGNLWQSNLFYLLAVSLLLMAWIWLNPEADLAAEGLNAENISTIKAYKLDSTATPHEAYWQATETRMLQLEKYHLISQDYVLQIPYLCQIYHLLNLKHLESIHGFSLNGLKVVNVSQFKATPIGGAIKFQTVLDSSLNLLRIWRQPVVEVELILHTPYTVELNIPIYNDKAITVIFNILPLSHNNHKLFVDIYSDVLFPKIPLRILLHFASSLTVLEDMPYLRKLAGGNIWRLDSIDQRSYPKTMQLFKRFTDLYGSSLVQPQLAGAVELKPVQAIEEIALYGI